MVTRWSAPAIAELRSLERGSTGVVAREIRKRAQQLASAAGREQVERSDLSEALVQYYAEQEGDGDED
jgi:histone H3/H4